MTCPPTSLKPTAKAKKPAGNQNAIPAPAAPINLTFVTSDFSGRGFQTQQGLGQAITNGNGNFEANAISDAEKRKDFDIPISLYPKVSDFLMELDENASDPRNLSQYIDILSSQDYLGFVRINEIIDATDHSVQAGKWLKSEMDSSGMDAEGYRPISQGSANFLYKAIIKSVGELRSALYS